MLFFVGGLFSDTNFYKLSFEQGKTNVILTFQRGRLNN